MTHTTPRSRISLWRTHLFASCIALCTAIMASPASAAVFDGGGVQQGIGAANNIRGIAKGDIRTSVTRILREVLNYLALLATVMVIIAGIYYIISMGEDDRKEKAKKIIQYTLIGLAIVLFSRAIVAVVTVYLASKVS